MTYIIAEPCIDIKDLSCVDVCPVDCIHQADRILVIDPEEVADLYPDIPIVGFTNHTDTAGLRRANAAGFDQVLAKSSLDERAHELIQELLSPVE